MKQLLLLSLVILSVGCTYNHRPLAVFLRNGSGTSERTTQIDVDSVTETTRTSAVIWIDGHKTTIYAEEIMIANGGAGF
jgi:hypothetical protein